MELVRDVFGALDEEPWSYLVTFVFAVLAVQGGSMLGGKLRELFFEKQSG